MDLQDSPVAVIDVRAIRPLERHAIIMNRFDHLKAGESMELVNDHHPLPLFMQFDSTRRDTFVWDTLEAGPEVWRVRIGKRAGPATGGCCGGCGGRGGCH